MVSGMCGLYLAGSHSQDCRTVSLTVVSNPCNIWSGGEVVAENEVTYRNMLKTWVQGNETCFVFLDFYL